MTDYFFRRLRDRGLVALVALLFSVGLWFRVVGGERIEATKTVKIEYKLPKDLTLFSPFQSEITIRFRGPAPFVAEFQKQDLIIPVDLSQYGTGENDIMFQASQFKVPLGIDLTQINPPSMKVFLDREVRKRVAIRPVLSTQLPEDYKIESIVVQPSVIEVKGSRIRLGLLSSLPTEIIYLTDNSLNQHFEASLNLSDFWGVEPTDKISTVHVEVNLKGPSKRKHFRGIPVKLRLGTASRSRVIEADDKRYRLRPKTVDFLLEGPGNLIDEMESGKIDVWVQMPELKKGQHQQRLTWKLSPEVRIIDRSADLISVQVP
jgi:YbbR domain-containing protein